MHRLSYSQNNKKLAFPKFKWQILASSKKTKYSYSKFIFLSRFSFTNTIIHRSAEEKDSNILVPLEHFHLLTNLTNWHDHLYCRLLIDVIYPLLRINTWLVWLIPFISTYSFMIVKPSPKDLPKYCKENLQNTQCSPIYVLQLLILVTYHNHTSTKSHDKELMIQLQTRKLTNAEILIAKKTTLVRKK